MRLHTIRFAVRVGLDNRVYSVGVRCYRKNKIGCDDCPYSKICNEIYDDLIEKIANGGE